MLKKHRSKSPHGRVKQFLTLFVQVGILSAALRFQRPLAGGTKTAPGGRPASRQQKSGFPK